MQSVHFSGSELLDRAIFTNYREPRQSLAAILEYRRRDWGAMKRNLTVSSLIKSAILKSYFGTS
jgi:hypothetical protein